MTSKGRYRCRLVRNGKFYEHYTTSLKKATTWLNGLRTTLNKGS